MSGCWNTRTGFLIHQKAMSKTDATGLQNSGTTEQQITGPHHATDATGENYDYYTCTGCGLETTDETIETRGCPRCQG